MSVDNKLESRLDRIIDQHGNKFLFAIDNLVWPILVIAFIFFTILVPEAFASVENIKFLLYTSATIGAIVLAESIVLLTGNFDLSVGAMTGFTAMFTAMWLANWFPGTPGIAGIFIILAAGGVLGLINGISVVYIGVAPFLQTLAALVILEGGTTVLSTTTVFRLPDTYVFLGNVEIAGIPLPVFVMFGLYGLAWVFLKYTRFGVAIYATGGDEEAAEKAGVNTNFVVLMSFTIAGVLCGFAGLNLTGFLGAASPGLASNALFTSFTAAVIGGISLFGGRGNIIGALGGTILIGTLQAGLVMLQVETAMIQFVNGLLLLGAILLYTSAERLRRLVLSNI